MKNEITNIPCEIIPVTEAVEQIQKKNCMEFPISEMPTLGIVGNEVLNFYNSYIAPGGEGLYRVTFPQGVTGTLSKFKTENAYLGSIRGDAGFSQARLTQVSINPEQMLMALALMSINCKLTAIMETQTKILNFMYDNEESKLSAGINELNEALEDYKINWAMEGYINQSLGLVKDKKSVAHKALELYRKQIANLLSTPGYPHTLKAANQKVSDIYRFLSDIHSAYYLLAYATFFECVLTKNFGTANIESIKARMAKYAEEYSQLYGKCSEWAKNYITSSMNYIVAPVLRGADDFYGALLSKAPFDLGKLYKNDRQNYISYEEQEKQLEHYKILSLNGFKEGIESIRLFYNERTEIYIDSQNIYLLNQSASEAEED